MEESKCVCVCRPYTHGVCLEEDYYLLFLFWLFFILAKGWTFWTFFYEFRVLRKIPNKFQQNINIKFVAWILSYFSSLYIPFEFILENEIFSKNKRVHPYNWAKVWGGMRRPRWGSSWLAVHHEQIQVFRIISVRHFFCSDF